MNTPPNGSMTQDEFLRYIDQNSPNDFVLLDVRQPGEYEELHLPGAFLIPLPDLADSLDDMDRSKPVIVYCRTGGRSRAAASIMAGQGFLQAVSLQGGIAGYQGEPAIGPVTQGMTLLPQNATLEQALQLAVIFETNLERFYQELANAETGPIRKIFLQLAAFEEGHVRVLEKLIGKIPLECKREEAVVEIAADILEGGLKVEELFQDNFQSPQEVLEGAMSLEAQALDLYMRYRFRTETETVRQVCAELARQEQEHLKILAQWLESIIQ